MAIAQACPKLGIKDGYNKQVSEEGEKTRLNRPQRSWYRAFRWGDGLLVLVVVLLAGFLFGLNFVLARPSSVSAFLYCDGDLIRQWDAQTLQEGGEESLELNGYHFRLEWGEGQIRFAEADCPDQVCVRSGWLGTTRGRVAACLPAGLVLKLSDSPSGTDDVDLVIR